MYLLKEVSTLTESKLVEANGSKKHFIEGVFIQAEQKNKNNRIYPLEIIAKEVDRYVKEMVNTNRALGELEHPEQVEVNLKETSHKIESLEFDGNNVIGRAKLIDTPNGRIAKALLEEGVQFGVSTRGLGSVNEKNGVYYVQDDFYMTAIDIVSDPSAPDAFVTSLVESKQWVWENGKIKEKQLQAYKKKIHKVSRSKLEETFVYVFKDFMSKMSSK